MPNDTVLTLGPPLIDDEEEQFELVDMPLRLGELDLVLLQCDLRLIDVDSILTLRLYASTLFLRLLTASRSVPMCAWIEAL
jgi:hypothetical protein